MQVSLTARHLQHQTEHTNHCIHFQKPIILPTGFLTATKGGSSPTPELFSEGGVEGGELLESAVAALRYHCILFHSRTPNKTGTRPRRKKTNWNSLTIHLTPFSFLLSDFQLLAGSEDGGRSCMAVNDSFPHYLMHLIKRRPRRIRVQSKAGSAARPAGPCDVCFTLHIRVPWKGRRERGEEDRQRQAFHFQIKHVCSTCFFCFFRINPKSSKPKGKSRLSACTSRDSPP